VLSLEALLLLGSVAVLAAVVSVRVATRTGLPSLLLFLGLGLLLGESGFGIEFSDFDLARDLCFAALAVILAEGGLTTRWRTTRPVLGVAIALSTIGVVVSVLVVGLAAYYLLGVEPRTAALMGAVVASTDAAAVFSVLRRVPLRRNIGATLEAESGLNDPPVIILVTVLASNAWEDHDVVTGIGEFFLEVLVGVVVGLVVGKLGTLLLNRSALPTAGLYPLATIALSLASFGAAALLHGSGFLAVFLTGIVLGNSALPHRRATLAFAEGTALLAQIGLFVVLGLLASPSKLPEVLLPALLVGGVLTFVARPLGVFFSTAPFGTPRRDILFMSWAGLRGAVPIAAATIPVSAGIDDADYIFNVVFVLVIVYTLLQAPSLPWAAAKLGVARSGALRDVEVESAPLDELRAELLQFTVPDDSLMHGVYVDELLLPSDSRVSLVVRDGHPQVPSSFLRLQHGDQVLIVTSREARAITEQRLQAVAERGRLAQWRTPLPGDDQD
jgi:cell volume regulation protein A